MSVIRTNPRFQSLLLTLQFVGDSAVILVGLITGYLLRFHSPLQRIGVESSNPDFGTYSPLLILGSILMLGSFAHLGLYDPRLLLRPHRATNIILRGIFFWFLLFLGTSLIMKFEPSISRIFVATSCLTALALLVAWRFAFYEILSRSSWRERIIQKVVFLGWNSEAMNLAHAIHTDRNHPYTVGGVITTPGTKDQLGRDQHPLGPIDRLEELLKANSVDIVVVADLDLSRDELLQVASICERRYVDFKVIPSFFQVFVSNLRMQTISGVPLLGVEQIPLNALTNRMIKRVTDIAGACFGLLLSSPIIAVLAILVRREGPGPILYRQIRTGLHGRPFTIYKLRSMKVDAETGTGPQWAVQDDPRRLKIGAFMREWNLDELPQFWNVLNGDMSLVGPRPERPELIKQFEHEIPHYNPRHSVRPGLSGWAQVNGLRGNTSLVERIRYDLYYIENWSFWFDIQIMILTFFRRQNAY